jgi:hypothetical protein
MVHSAENQADLCGTEEDTEHDKIGSCDINVLWPMDGSENGGRKEWQQHSADQMGVHVAGLIVQESKTFDDL